MERMVTRAMRRRLEEEEEELGVDHISQLPDTILGEIVCLLPTKDGGRTQVLSSRWRDVWRSAPLNIDVARADRIPIAKISGILSLHPGPGRRFSIPMDLLLEINHPAGRGVILDGWLQSPALSNLQELKFDYGYRSSPLPSSVHRFSATLRDASFSGCGGFPDGDSCNALQFPLLKKLSLCRVDISDSSMNALLAGCPIMESLLLRDIKGLFCIRVVSDTLRSLVVKPGGNFSSLKQVIIEDAPSLDRLLLIPYSRIEHITISVVYAPKLESLGPLSDKLGTLQFGTTIFQGSHLVSLMTLVPSVKVLALTQSCLSLVLVINFVQCFPCLELLYIKTYEAGKKNIWSRKYRNLIRTLNISLKKIVLEGYRGNKSYVQFAKFFILNARVLQSMIFEVLPSSRIRISSEWIEKQHRLLQPKDTSLRGASFHFVEYAQPGPLGWVSMAEVAHDLSTVDPFVRMKGWSY